MSSLIICAICEAIRRALWLPSWDIRFYDVLGGLGGRLKQKRGARLRSTCESDIQGAEKGIKPQNWQKWLYLWVARGKCSLNYPRARAVWAFSARDTSEGWCENQIAIKIGKGKIPYKVTNHERIHMRFDFNRMKYVPRAFCGGCESRGKWGFPCAIRTKSEIRSDYWAERSLERQNCKLHIRPQSTTPVNVSSLNISRYFRMAEIDFLIRLIIADPQIKRPNKLWVER